MERRKFLSTSLGLGAILGAGCTAAADVTGKQNRTLPTIPLKGKKESAITHWDVVTIGNLSRNRYWGESEEEALHSVICTTTVISGKNFHVMVDPSLKDSSAMAEELKRRTGLVPENINVVFVTHEHGDHHAGIQSFPNARWYATEATAKMINTTEKYIKNVEPAPQQLFSAIDVVPTPGHTPGTAGLRFDYHGLSVFVCGDSVATRDFWDEGRVYFKALDMEMSHRSMKKIAAIADVIVPGHDNYFINV